MSWRVILSPDPHLYSFIIQVSIHEVAALSWGLLWRVGRVKCRTSSWSWQFSMKVLRIRQLWLVCSLFSVPQGVKKFCLSFCFVCVICVKRFLVCCVVKVRSYKWVFLSSALTPLPCFCWCLRQHWECSVPGATSSSNFTYIRAKNCVFQFSFHYYWYHFAVLRI